MFQCEQHIGGECVGVKIKTIGSAAPVANQLNYNEFLEHVESPVLRVWFAHGVYDKTLAAVFVNGFEIGLIGGS
jgi:hypothetical protein